MAPFDAELFGHWWFEGPQFLAELFRQAPRQGVGLATLRETLSRGDALTSLGFTVRTKPLREVGHDSDQRQFARANLDVEIAIDLMAVAHRIDEVWVMSGSRDLERLLEVLRIRGLKVVLMSTEGMVPRELRNAADRFVDLSSLKPQLEKTDGH